jgi:hypothetical protein
MVPKRPPNSKELYFPYYPSNPLDWPLFLRTNWDLFERIFYPRSWGALIETLVSPRRWNLRGLNHIFTRLLQLLRRDTRIPRINWKRLNPLKLRSNLIALGRLVARHLVKASRNGPKAKEIYLKKLANDRANFKGYLPAYSLSLSLFADN